MRNKSIDEETFKKDVSEMTQAQIHFALRALEVIKSPTPQDRQKQKILREVWMEKQRERVNNFDF